ncbi:MAG: prolipoprotein diacylglyceryl transferase family protein [Christensenellales bacterium]
MLDEAAYFLLGNIKIYYYGLHIALGALAAVIVLALCCRARRMPAGAAPLYAVLAMPLGVACSRVLFCLLDGRFRGIFSLRAMLCFWGGGHSMVGALLGAALAAVIAAKILAVPARRMLDMMVPALLVFIAFARVGEQYTEMLGAPRAGQRGVAAGLAGYG